MASSNYYRCQIAGCPFVSLTINELLRHLKVVNHRDFKSGCCIEGCMEKFDSFAAMKSHMYRKHYIRPAVPEDESHSVYDLEVDTDAQFQENSHMDLQADVNRLFENDIVQQKRSSALLLMKLKEVRRMSQVAIDDVVSGSQELFCDTSQRLKAGVRQKLAEAGVDAKTSEAVDAVFEELYDPFTGLDTEYLQTQYINETFKVVVSWSLTLGLPPLSPLSPSRFSLAFYRGVLHPSIYH